MQHIIMPMVADGHSETCGISASASPAAGRRTCAKSVCSPFARNDVRKRQNLQAGEAEHARSTLWINRAKHASLAHSTLTGRPPNPNTIELAGRSWPVANSHSLPPCGGGLGWGGRPLRNTLGWCCQGQRTPHPGPPPQGGRGLSIRLHHWFPANSTVLPLTPIPLNWPEGLGPSRIPTPSPTRGEGIINTSALLACC
jgi:hypothetical protein